ncbi:GAF domain-containing protein [uncultured Sphingomonas sp.]|uniref:GAF domain-containing protein n=1 Tax=uncultured Sphingomonas sp. TaxID=158754 RepID=UPI0025F5FA29|nr:GAF domain-containing protein [uncultured Sphingomonas sp.]
MRIDFFSPAPRPVQESLRQDAVVRSGLLQRGGDADLQRIVQNASARFHTPIAAISVIDRDRQWFVARTGLLVEETPRAMSFCAHAVHRPGEPLVVPDATADWRFQGNPLVTSSPHIRFYAGVPLVDRTGYALGALCIIDAEPRDEDVDLFELSLLAREAEAVINR